ncbi:SDR family NAD(P)-dependent oxidoreductase [Aggregatilinea lenta]|uniref:SDR family NAD(P)-dependent oxidoreductase n=1 Tax=Aggregatilinea lenta TaxID=913108 RepID=UPI000E5B5668|nr:SDR family oxidoreductase [Aggregatilinea lenta]
MARRFEDKVVVVTGGSRGIGYAIASALVDEGATVIVASKNSARGTAAAEVLNAQDGGGRAAFVATDVTDKAQVEAMVAQVLAQHGRIDALVNNAGVHDKAAFCDESEDLWQVMYRQNVMGVVLPSQAVVRDMQRRGEGGAIVHVSSKAGVVGEPGHAAYSAAKGAVIALTRAMAVELAWDQIRVNVVCPGPVLTDMLTGNVTAQADRDALGADAPLGRIGLPEDIAGAVLYLASADSGWCTGQAINVDGGLSILK